MTDPVLIIGALALGAILGSFLNALTFRYNTGAPVWRAMQGRSRCMRCGHELGVLDLVPIFSWILLRGRCRWCRSRISVQYPAVEIAAAALSVGVYLQYPQPAAYAFWMLVWMIILFLVVYDWRHYILPIEGLAILGVLAFSSHTPPFGPFDPWSLLAGPLLAAPLTFLSLISRGRWMGWGDGILALPLGWILGLSAGFTALIFSFWIGAAVSVVLILVSRLRSRGSLTLKSALPFGPFLALGAAIVFFTRFDLFIGLGWLA